MTPSKSKTIARSTGQGSVAVCAGPCLTSGPLSSYTLAMTPLIVFDDGLGELAPLNDLRASFDIRTGALTTLERLRLGLELEVQGLIVPAALEELTRERHAFPVNVVPKLAGPAIVINGRCAIPHGQMLELKPGQKLVESGTGHLIAAGLAPSAVEEFFRTLEAPGEAVAETPEPGLISRPWHVKTFRDHTLEIDLEILADSPTQELPPGVLAIGDGSTDSDLTIDPSAVVYPGVTLDIEHGPVVIAARATVRPGAILIGPAYIGAGSTVLERAVIRAHTAIGPTCKVAGEVGGVIFQGYANKAHDGYLGDSWVGEWANLGAGTTGSNLLNTYGEVVACAGPGGRNERTGEQFLGSIIGDHCKFAIMTRLMTGTVIHTGSMIAQTAPVAGCVPPFAWWTDAQRKTYRFDKFLDVARAVMSRRGITPSEAYVRRLEELQAARIAAEGR